MILVILTIGWIARALGSPGMDCQEWIARDGSPVIDRQGLGSDGLDRWGGGGNTVNGGELATGELIL